MRRPSAVRIWNVLQIRVAGRQPPGSRHRLVVAGVDAPCAIDLLRQLVGVGALELAHLPYCISTLGSGKSCRQFLQHRLGGGGLAGGGLADYRQAQLDEEGSRPAAWATPG